MTTYTWKVQFSENYTDEFIQKGPIDKEKAVEEFQLFPWDKEIDDYKRRDDNPTVPKIIFNSDDNRQLVLASTSNKGYEAEYTNILTNKFSNFYLSSNFEKKNYTPEEIIEFFFDNTLEEHIDLKDIPKPIEKKPADKKSPDNLEYNFRPSFRPLFSFNFFFWLGLSVCYILLAFKEPSLPKWVLFFFAITWPIPIMVHLTYYLKNSGAKVIIDKRNHDLTYIKGSQEIKFNRDDIFRCQVTYSKNTRWSLCDDYSYVWFILHDRTYIVITHFVADPNEIVEKLNCKFETRASGAFLPII
ncbi:MAG: hypothetical protein JNK73_05790 [Bacteroidia bacterium]|nr:hypothetical protein [Bacteroidia bacterium]